MANFNFSVFPDASLTAEVVASAWLQELAVESTHEFFQLNLNLSSLAQDSMAAYRPVNLAQVLQQLHQQLDVQFNQVNMQLGQIMVQSNAHYNNLRILGHNQQALCDMWLHIHLDVG